MFTHLPGTPAELNGRFLVSPDAAKRPAAEDLPQFTPQLAADFPDAFPPVRADGRPVHTYEFFDLSGVLWIDTDAEALARHISEVNAELLRAWRLRSGPHRAA